MTELSPPPWRSEDLDFVRSLENGSLPAETFDHRGHLRYAWLLLRAEPLAQVLPRVDAALTRFATLNGAPEKYHQTVTWTYLLVIHELMESDAVYSAGATESFDTFLCRHPLLSEAVPAFMSRFYARKTWQSQRAAETYLLPDRIRHGLAA